ncbi:MAG: YggT family protein [Chloroflexi bacterium]|nr:YggT family protein [Chloroflexota bacterium]MCZ6708156.1 YggT family protein [Chloroflexota bacterium]
MILVGYLVWAYFFIVLLRVLMSWVPMFTQRPLDYSNPIVKILLNLTEPVLAPLRRFLIIGMLDLSPMVVLFSLGLIAGALTGR